MLLHIIPINDIKEHNEIVKNHLGLMIGLCDCQPKTICSEIDKYIIVHSSFDGREALEEANSIIACR